MTEQNTILQANGFKYVGKSQCPARPGFPVYQKEYKKIYLYAKHIELVVHSFKRSFYRPDELDNAIKDAGTW